MNINKKIGTYIFGSLTAVFAIISIILRCVNLFLFYDSDIASYKVGAVLPIVSDTLLTIFVVLTVIAVFILFKKGSAEIVLSSPAKYAAALPAIACLALAVSDIFNFFKGIPLNSINYGNFVTKLFVAREAYILMFLLSILSALYFVSVMLNASKTMSTVFGLCFIVRIVHLLGSSYLDSYTNMNSPDKIIYNVACGIAMLAFVSELRVLSDIFEPRRYICTNALGMILCSVASLPYIVAYHANALDPDTRIYAEYYIFLAIAVYFGVRFFAAIFAKAKTCDPSENNDCEENS